jgi:hypothetical protein
MVRTIGRASAVTALVACGASASGQGPDVGQGPTGSSQEPQTGAKNGTGGQDARDAGHNPEAGAFGATCASGSDCASDTCYLGGKGGFCSLACTSDSQCPPGADGSAPHCNPHGYCRY